MIQPTVQPSQTRGLSTARSVLRVLQLLSDRPGGVTLAEVGQFLGKSSHTAYYLLNTLCQEEFAQKGPDHRYRACTSGAVSPNPTLEMLYDSLAELNLTTQCRSYLVLYGDNGVSLEHVQGKQGQLGVRLEDDLEAAAHATAVGKSILAHLSPERLELHVQRKGLQRFTAQTITDLEHLTGELRQIHQEGVAYDLGEYAEDIFCIAAPVLFEGLPAASLGIVVPRGRFSKQAGQLSERVLEAARSVSC